MELPGNIAVSNLMHIILRAVIVIALGHAGCATAPPAAPSQVVPWPDEVSQTCAKPKVSLCCFRTGLVEPAMHKLVDKFRACGARGAHTVTVMLTIETRGGFPSCVEYTASPSPSPFAQCVANTVARHFFIPQSHKDERCGFRYPVQWQQSEK